MRRRRESEPEGLGALVPKVLDELGLDLQLRVVRIAACWEEAVGTEVASHCRPVSVRDGRLEACADSSVWCQQLQLQAPEILAALARVLGDEAPKEVRFRVG